MSRSAIYTVASLLLPRAALSLATAQTGTTAGHREPCPAASSLPTTSRQKRGWRRSTTAPAPSSSREMGGNVIELKVGPNAKNFDQVKVGDQVQADFYTSTAIFLRKSSAPPSAAAAEGGGIGGARREAGRCRRQHSEISATVDAIDPQTRMISLNRAARQYGEFQARRCRRDLDQIHPGRPVVGATPSARDGCRQVLTVAFRLPVRRVRPFGGCDP